MVMQHTAEMYRFKTIIIVFLKGAPSNLMLNSVVETMHIHTVHSMVMQRTAEMYQFKTIIVFVKGTLSNLMLNSVILTAIQFSEETMEKAVTVMTQLNSLVTQCDGYVQGRFDCPDISQPELYAK